MDYPSLVMGMLEERSPCDPDMQQEIEKYLDDGQATFSVLLLAQFSQMRPIPMQPSIAPRMPMFPPGARGLGQVFYRQAPAFNPPQVLIQQGQQPILKNLHCCFGM